MIFVQVYTTECSGVLWNRPYEGLDMYEEITTYPTHKHTHKIMSYFKILGNKGHLFNSH